MVRSSHFRTRRAVEDTARSLNGKLKRVPEKLFKSYVLRGKDLMFETPQGFYRLIEAPTENEGSGAPIRVEGTFPDDLAAIRDRFFATPLGPDEPTTPLQRRMQSGGA